MLVAGCREKEIAVSKGHVDPDGTPYVTVILDGGWSKRPYGHNYSAYGAMVRTISNQYKICPRKIY
jgi:hypothetical protein